MLPSRTLLLGVGLSLAACSDDATGPTRSFAGIDFDRGSIVVAPGDSTLLSATVRDDDGDPVAGAQVAWSSSDESVVTVDDEGVVHGVEIGVASIRATSGELEAEIDVVVGFAPGAVALEPGDWHSCRLSREGLAECWGSGAYGELGSGAPPEHDCNGAACVQEPDAIASAERFSSIAAGAGHTCATTSEGAAWCWGINYDGLLGAPAGDCDGTPCNRTPARVAEDIVFRSVVAGTYFTCGIALDRSAWCWGVNYSGELGSGSQVETSTTPLEVAGEHEFAALAAGTSHVCGIDVEGAAWCWGSRSAGQLGDGIGGVDAEVAREPVAVGSDARFVALAAGDAHTCAIDDGGAAWCWGMNAQGQTGTTTTQQCNGFFGTFPCQTLPAAVSGGHEFMAITAGYAHTCAIDEDGVAYCWGTNIAGQLGIGTLMQDRADAPTAVDAHQRWSAIAAGNSHTCAAVAGTGDTYCWGDNNFGQLGTGSTELALAPKAVRP